MKVLAANWWALALRGLAGVVFGGLTLLFPGISLAAMVLVFGAYALAGLTALMLVHLIGAWALIHGVSRSWRRCGSASRSRERPGWPTAASSPSASGYW
jgi:uncharacterized membrane protein HdeD (DUF308 family)